MNRLRTLPWVLLFELVAFVVLVVAIVVGAS
jgi:hypothetical protein